jgi:ribose transport system substrate-binding protein
MRVPMLAAAGCAALISAGLIAGCGDDDERAPSASSGAEQQSEPVRVAVIMASLGNDFYVAQKEGIEGEAAGLDGVELEVSAGRTQSSTDEIVGLIENAMAKDVDAIAVNGSDTEPLLPVLRRVIDAGTPLVLFDAPANELEGEIAAYVGTDNEAGGRAGGEWMAEQLPGGGRVGVVLCVAGHPVTVARLKGFKAGLGDGFELVATADAQCDPERGRKVVENMISAHASLDAVFSTSDSQSLGAVKALDAAGKDPVFVSFDAQAPVVEAITAGDVIDASVAWSAKQIGAEAVRAAVGAARGEQVEKRTLVPVTVVDAENAAGWDG